MPAKKQTNQEAAIEDALIEAQDKGEADFQGTIWFPDTVMNVKETQLADGSVQQKVVAILPGYYPQVQIDHYRAMQEKWPKLNDPKRMEEQGFLLGVEEPPKMVAVDLNLNSEAKKSGDQPKLPTGVVRQSN